MSLLKSTLLISLLGLFSCDDKVVNNRQFDSDTLKILRPAIYEGVTDEFMPSASTLKRPYRFGDSILLTSNKLSLDLLPSSIKNQNFKVLSEQQICSMIIADSNIGQVPNYLSIGNFEKSDTGYYVQMRSLSCYPFGGGGTLGLYFKKIADSLIIVDRAASSIN